MWYNWCQNITYLSIYPFILLIASFVICWLVDWLVDWLAGWLAVQLAGCPAGWLAGWLVGWLIAWLIDWSIDRSINYYLITHKNTVITCILPVYGWKCHLPVMKIFLLYHRATPMPVSHAISWLQRSSDCKSVWHDEIVWCNVNVKTTTNIKYPYHVYYDAKFRNMVKYDNNGSG